MCLVCFLFDQTVRFSSLTARWRNFSRGDVCGERLFRIKFLENVRSRVHPNLHAEFGRRLVRGPMIRVVCIRNRNSRGVAQPLRVVWLNMARVSARYEALRERIPQPPPAASSAAPEISGILMQEAGKDGFRHIIAHYKAAVRCSEILSIAGGSLSEGAVRISRLRRYREERTQSDRSPIPGILSRNSEFLANGERTVIR